MKILYLSCHSVLEYQELTLLTEMDSQIDSGLDIEVFSMGAYMNPTQSGDYLRSVIPKGRFYPELYAVGMQCSKDLIHEELIQWCDVVLSMHNSAVPGQRSQQPWIVNNWQNFRKHNKKVVWRSIGQSTPAIEQELKPYHEKGLTLIRYSPTEDRIPHFAGADALIRFSESPDEYFGWKGDKKQVITLAQSFKKRGEHLGFAVFDKVTGNFPRKVFGTENDDLGEMNGGQISYQHLKNELKENRVFFYYGTQPAPYTMSFIEAMMTGIPIVAVGPKIRNSIAAYSWQPYEIGDIITNGVNGFISDNIGELTGYIDLLMKDDETAKRISQAGRETAIRLFGREQRQREWADLFRRL